MSCFTMVIECVVRLCLLDALFQMILLTFSLTNGETMKDNILLTAVLVYIGYVHVVLYIDNIKFV